MSTNATVLGAGEFPVFVTVSIPFTSASNAAVAQSALGGITRAVDAHTLTQVNYTGSSTLPGAATAQIGVVEQGTCTVPLAPFAIGNNYVSAVLNGAAQQTIVTGPDPGQTVVAGLGGAIVGNLGSNTQVFFAGNGKQQFVELGGGVTGLNPSASVWLDGNATFDDSAGSTLVHIDTVAGSEMIAATTLILTNNGNGTTTVDVAANDSGGGVESDIISFTGTSTVAATVNAAGGADSLGAATGGVALIAFVTTADGFIQGNGSNVVLFGGSTGVATLFGGSGKDTDAGSGGLIEAGKNGGSSLFGSTIAGSTTLMGGGEGDMLASLSNNTLMVAGPGNESLYAFQPSTFKGFSGTATPGGITTFQSEAGGNLYLTGNGQTSIASNGTGGNLFQEGITGAGNTATISGFASGLDSISVANPTGGNYTLITSGTPAANQVELSVDGSTSTVLFGDGTTWTFNSAVRIGDFYHGVF